jgi:hypothetical protein
VIREAYGYPKFMMGEVEDVNRASADASERFFARYHTEPRCDRWKGLLNNDFLPLFGPDQRALYEFDYDSPVETDEELDNATRDSKSKAWVALTAAGADPGEVSDYLEMPEFTVTKPEPPPQLAPGGDGTGDGSGETGAAPSPGATNLARLTVAEFLALQGAVSGCGHGGGDGRGRLAPLTAEADNGQGIDLSSVQRDWQDALDRLLRQWDDVSSAQRTELKLQITEAVDRHDVTALQHLGVSSNEAAQLLAVAMAEIAAQGAKRAQAEAADQGVSTSAGHADDIALHSFAVAAAALIAAALVNSAGRDALRRYSSTARGADVAKGVDQHLSELSDSFLRDNLGGALGRAQMAGRLATFKIAPEASLYGSEILDSHICANCRAVNGKFLGLSTDTQQVDLSYPNGQYVNCLGGLRCRGQVVAVWRTETTQSNPEMV